MRTRKPVILDTLPLSLSTTLLGDPWMGFYSSFIPFIDMKGVSIAQPILFSKVDYRWYFRNKPGMLKISFVHWAFSGLVVMSAFHAQLRNISREIIISSPRSTILTGMSLCLLVNSLL